jgi:hypothetical protein
MTPASSPPMMTPHKRLTPQAARARTLRVKATRWVFVGGAALSILALVGSVAVRMLQTALAPVTSVVRGDNLVIDEPRFVGRTKGGAQIVVTADSATRSRTLQERKVTLVKPKLQTGDGSQAKAKAGVWSQADQSLSLEGDVELTRTGGDRATSTTAVWTTGDAQFMMSGAVNLNRSGGTRATSNSAIWRTELGLLDLMGNVTLNLPTGESASALSARLDERRGDISLEGQAVVRFASGQANSARAFYSSATGTLSGDGGTNITSSFGTGRAQRYVYEITTNRLNLSGNAQATLK